MNHQCMPETAKIFIFALSKMVFRDFLMISATFTQQYIYESIRLSELDRLVSILFSLIAAQGR